VLLDTIRENIITNFKDFLSADNGTFAMSYI